LSGSNGVPEPICGKKRIDIYHKELLVCHYKSIFMQNKEKVERGGIGDGFLLSSATDARMAITLLTSTHHSVADNIHTHLSKIKRI